MIASSAVDKERVLGADWKDEKEFITVGLKHVKLWTLNGRNLTAQKGVFGSTPIDSHLVVCYAFGKKVCISGDARGNLVTWSGRSATKSIKAHNGAIWALHTKKDKLFSGGLDGFIKVYNSKMEETENIDISKLTSFGPGVRSIDTNSKGVLLIGTKGGDVIYTY